MNGFRGVTIGAATFTRLETAVLVGANGLLNFSMVTLSYEGGVAVGSAVNASTVIGSEGTVRDWWSNWLAQ